MSNYHATDAFGRSFKTKKALREAVANDPSLVIFTHTSAFYSRGSLYGPDGLDPSDVIVGPNPYERKWYANVRNGKVV